MKKNVEAVAADEPRLESLKVKAREALSIKEAGGLTNDEQKEERIASGAAEMERKYKPPSEAQDEGVALGRALKLVAPVAIDIVSIEKSKDGKVYMVEILERDTGNKRSMSLSSSEIYEQKRDLREYGRWLRRGCNCALGRPMHS